MARVGRGSCVPRIPWQRAAAVSFVLIACLTLTGCWDLIPVEERAVVTAIGVDGSAQAKTQMWTFVVPNITATAANVSSLSPSQQFFTVRVPATGWNQAETELAARLSRLPYFGQLQAVVFAERLPTAKVATDLTDLNAQTGIPKSFFVVVSEDKAASLASAVMPDEVVPRYWLMTYLACKVCHPMNLAEYAWEWWANFESGGDSPIAPVFALKAGTPRLVGIDVYKDAGVPVRMGDGAVEGFALLTNRTHALSLTAECEGHAVRVERLAASAHVTAADSGSIVVAHVQLRATGSLVGVLPHSDVASYVTAAEGAVARVLLARAAEAVVFANRTGTDPMGWNERAAWRAKRPTGWLGTGPVPLRPLRAVITVRVHLREEGVYGT